MPDQTQVSYRLGQLRTRLAFQHSRLTYKGHVIPDRRTVAQQNYDHTVKFQIHLMIREIDIIMGDDDPTFMQHPPSNREWPPWRKKRRIR